MTKAVVLTSGGIDSATVLAMALNENEEVLAVQINYGSKHSAVEQFAAMALQDWYVLAGQSLSLRTVTLPNIFGGAGSALMPNDEQPMPHQTYEEIHNAEGPSPTVVPFRNANLLSVATTLAVVNGANFVYCGMHGEDAHNWAYPDCSPEFLGAMANAIRVGTYDRVRLKFPLIWMTKAEVVAMAEYLSVPAHLTWSCYDPQYVQVPILALGNLQTKHCGKCPTCVERINAFQMNGLIDPVEYAILVDWSDCDAY